MRTSATTFAPRAVPTKVLTLIAALILATASLPARQQGSAADSLADVERAFARLSVKIGSMPAFLAYFGDDVVTFQPAPVHGRDRLRARAAASPFPSPNTLDWEPWFAEVSSDGNLGFTTGPSIVTERATGKILYTGWYFSVWKRDANTWRVVADIGVAGPPVGPIRPKALVSVGLLPAATEPATTIDALFALERALAGRAASGLATAYEGRLDVRTRLHRDGPGAIQGAEAILAHLKTVTKPPVGWKSLGGAVSASGDLGYTYGYYNVPPADPAPAGDAASFLHVWKRNASGSWVLAADVVNGKE